MKKLLCILIAVVTVLFSVPFASALQAGTYKVKTDVAYIYSSADALSSVKGEITNGKYIDITEISKGFGFAFFPSKGFSGWVEMNKLTPVDEDPTETDITGIRVTAPDKTEYVHCEEELCLDGMRVFAVHADETEEEVTGYSVHADSFATPGTKTVTVTWSPTGNTIRFTTTFTVKVIELPITGITVTSMPYKTVYKEHELPDFSGLGVRIDYNDRPSESFTAEEVLTNTDFTLSVDPATPLEPGEQKLGISYKYETVKAEIALTVTPRKLISLTIKQMPDSLVAYSKKEMPSVKGLILHAVYDNGEEEDVNGFDCDESCDPSSFILGKGNKVTVSYKGLSVELSYTLSLNEIKGLYLVTPTVLTFWLGFDIDLSKLRVYYEYNDNTIEPVKEYTISAIDKSLCGTQNILVTCGEYSEVFSIYITPYYGKGDVNGSGVVDVTDARTALRAAVGFTTLGGISLTACDIDCNGKADVSDARMVLRQAVKLEDFVGDSKVILP